MLRQKLSELLEISRSYDINNFACFSRHGVNTRSVLVLAYQWFWWNCRSR